MFLNFVKLTLIILLLCVGLPVKANDVSTGIWEFIYGAAYLNIGTTTCQEIIKKSDEEGKKGEVAFLQQINDLIKMANNLAGKQTVNEAVVKDYTKKLYMYCKNHPDEMLIKALPIITKPMFKDMKEEINNQARQSNTNNFRAFGQANSSHGTDNGGTQPSNKQQSSGPIFIN